MKSHPRLFIKIVLLAIVLMASQILVAQDRDSNSETISPESHSASSHLLADLAEAKKWDQLKAHVGSKDDKATIDAAQPDGMTALHWAAYHGDLKTVDLLLRKKADVDPETVYQITPLSVAAQRGHDKIVQRLIQDKADENHQLLGKQTILMIAARQGNRSSIQHLIKAGAELDAREAKGQTALMWAAAAGNVEAVDELVRRGAKTQLTLSKSGYSAIMFAARNGHQAVVMRLLDAGCKVNDAIKVKRGGGRNPRNGMSALMLAVESGHLELALALVKKGANPNDQRSGYSPLHAISWVRKTKRGDDPEGDPPPRVVGKVHTLNFVEEMVKLGADVNLKLKTGSAGKARLNPKGATPFFLAAATADLPLLKTLTRLKADPHLTNADGCNAMAAAAGIGVIAVGEYPGTEEEVDAVIRFLHHHDVKINVADKNGETPMHGAAYRNYPSTVKLLSDLGADPKIWHQKNKHGWTPQMIAAGKRPGSLKPSPETIQALNVALKRGVVRSPSETSKDANPSN